MTVLDARRAPGTGPSPVLPVARALAAGEARRLATSPLVLLGAGLYLAVVVVASGQGPGSAYDVLLTGPTFFVGVFTYFAAALAASRPRRDGALEGQASTPAPAVARTAGLCLAASGPVALTLVLMGLISAWFAGGRADLPVEPSAAELAAGPLTVLGGALLGVLVARWLPFPTAPVLVMVGVVAATFVLNERWDGDYALLSPYATFSVFVPDGSWGGHTPGSPAWHAVYLAALCGMAAAGALLRDARRPVVPFLAGVAAFALAVVAGTAQLP